MLVRSREQAEQTRRPVLVWLRSDRTSFETWGSEKAGGGNEAKGRRGQRRRFATIEIDRLARHSDELSKPA